MRMNWSQQISRTVFKMQLRSSALLKRTKQKRMRKHLRPHQTQARLTKTPLSISAIIKQKTPRTKRSRMRKMISSSAEGLTYSTRIIQANLAVNHSILVLRIVQDSNMNKMSKPISDLNIQMDFKRQASIMTRSSALVKLMSSMSSTVAVTKC